LAKPTIRAPRFGRWLKARRGKGRSLEAVASRVRSRLEPLAVKFNRSQLLKIEEDGVVPNAVVLYELARIYRIDAGELLNLLVHELGLSSVPPALPEEPLPGEAALLLAQWFDTQAADRQRAIFSALGVTATDTTTATRKPTREEHGKRRTASAGS
jgi:transcriptional regulator with XRE-family HTH domain